MTDLPIQEVNG